MAKHAFLIVAALLAIGTTQPAWAADETAATPALPENRLDEMKFGLFSHRRTPNLYWRIDASGKGEVSAPQAVGYKVAAPLISSPEFHIAPGTHNFDIGETGYIALRGYLGQIIEGKIDPYQMTDGACSLRTVTDIGWAELDWAGKAKGQLHLRHECLNGTGQYFHDRMVLSWHKLAGLLHQRAVPFVKVERQTAMPIPRSLRFTETNVWAGATTNWQINANGSGLVGFSTDGNLPTLSISDTNFVKAGRYHFQLDRDFHQAVLRELDPYLSGTKTVGSCEDEIDTSDQPLVRIEWKDKTGKPSSFASDMGCPSFAERFGKVKLAFAELIKNRSLGDSKILRITQQKK